MSFVLTTIDNPFDPVKQFDSWYRFDMDHKYNSCALLDRVATSLPLNENESEEQRTQKAIDQIIKYDFQNLYTKVKANE